MSSPITLNQRFANVYKEIGSEEKLLEIVTEFYRRMARDILVGFFFSGKDLPHIARQQSDFLLRAMGVNQNYKGHTPARAHDKLAPILDGHFDRRLVILRETLTDFKLSQESLDAWVTFESQFRAVVVKK